MHELGGKITKPTQKKINIQLERVCGYKECDVSLAFTHKAMYCSKQHAEKERTRRRTMNRQKKKAFNERHGIKYDKNIRNRNFKPNPKTSPGVEYNGQNLLYENYKEPLKEIEKGKGYGYYGTVALTEDKSLVQCHICGNLYPAVGQHLSKHKISAEKYKEMYQLSAQTALISEPVRQMYQKQMVSKLKGKGLPAHLKEYNEKVRTGVIKHPDARHRGLSLEKRNKLGLCPDQVLEKIKDLQDILGKIPSYDEFNAHYKGRYTGSIVFQHGSWSNAVRKVSGMTRDDIRRPDNERLLKELRDFFEQHNRIPMTSDFNRGMLRNRGIYISRFGTLNNARIEAGMNAVLPMPFGQIVELTPEQYYEYKAGRSDGTFKNPHQKSSKRKAKKA